MELPSDPSMLCVVRAAMERLTEAFGFTESEVRSVTRAVDEALTNIMRHSYGGALNRRIELSCLRIATEERAEGGQGFEIRLVDYGPKDRSCETPRAKAGRDQAGWLGAAFHSAKYGHRGVSTCARSERASSGEVFGKQEGRDRKTDARRKIFADRDTAMGTTTVFDVTGDIDLANSPEVRKALLGEIKEKKTPKVVMNMSKVRYIDSSGVASLVEGAEGIAATWEVGFYWWD